MTRTNRHRDEILKPFPRQTLHFTPERIVLIKNIARNLALFGFHPSKISLFTIELDNCSLKHFSEGLNYLVQNNCKNVNNIRILNDSKTLEVDHELLGDLSETNLLNQVNFDLFFSLENRYPIATTVRFLKKQRLLTSDYFNKVFHHQHFEDLQTVINYLDMFLDHDELLPREAFDKILLVKDLKNLSEMFDHAVRSEDFKEKHIAGLKLIKQLINYSTNLTEEIKNSCKDVLFSNSVESCATSSKNSCRRWFKSVSSALDECTNNPQEKSARQKRSFNATNFNLIAPNAKLIEQTIPTLIGNSTNNIGLSVSSYLLNQSMGTFLLFTSYLVSWFIGKKLYVDKVLNDSDVNQSDLLDQIEKQVLYAIGKYGDKEAKEECVKTSSLKFFTSNNTNKLENKNSLPYSWKPSPRLT